MDVRCNRCGTEYELDEGRVAASGTTVKCSNCGHIFKVLPGGEVKEGSGVVARSSTRQPTSESSRVSSTPAASGAVPVAPSVPGEWMVRKVDGQVFRFRELTTLQKWIVERKVGRDDEISRTAKSWKKLGEIAELTSFFQVVEAADAAQRTVTASQMPQVHLTATATGTFQAVPMPVSQPPAPAAVVDELSNSHRPSPSRVLAPAPVATNDDLDVLDDNDPVLRWQRRRQWVLRTAVAAAVGLVTVAVIVVVLQRRPADLSPAVRLQVAAALTRGDDIARTQALGALSTSTVPAAPAVRARLQAESARALRDAVRLADDAVATAVTNAAPGVVPGTPPPPAPPLPAPAGAAATAERLLADAEAAVLTLRSAGVVEVDADLAAATIALTRGDAAGLDAAINAAREHARTLDDEAARAAVDEELRLLLTIAESTRLDPLDVEGTTETIAKLGRFTDARAMAASAQLQLQRLRAARSMALSKTPREAVDPAVVDVVGKAFSALPGSDPRRTAGTALVLALSSLPVEAVVVDPNAVVVDPNAPAPTPGTPPAPTTPPATPTTPATTAKVESPAGLLKQAWAALDAGRNSDAIRLFGKVLSLSPSTSEAQFGKAEALRFAGRKEEAVAAYQRYLELDPSGKDANIARNALKQLE